MSLKQFAESLLFFGPLFSEDESKKQQKRLGQVSKQYEMEREPLRQARMNALAQSMGLFEPLNSAMARLYGSDATFDFNKLLQDPMRDYASEVQRQYSLESADKINRSLAPGVTEGRAEAIKGIEKTFPGIINKIESENQGVVWNPKTSRFEVR